MKPRFYQLLILVCVSVPSVAQIQFINRNDLLRVKDINSGVPVGIADMNGDGLDDIIAMDEGVRLYVQYQTPDPERVFAVYTPFELIDVEEQNDICIADFNNDGSNDIFLIGSYDRAKVLYGIPNSYELDVNKFVVVPFFSQGASAGDFNGDGWVDVVALNDNGLNYSFMNDGSGQLVVDTFINFETVPPSDNSGNYGCVFTDFDVDGDLDFYIAKCRQGVNNPSDPRRINVLYENNGNNEYTENALTYGLASGHQTWTADFGDIDNDGDLDVLMIQHDVASELYENINNDTFINITASAGLDIGGIPLQGMFRDFDNDGFQDILVSGDRVDYFRNKGDNTFTREFPFGNIIFGTFALGDLNSDGFTDIYASRVIPFNRPDLLRPDILFMNPSNDHHFLALRLYNGAQNPSAIGAMALLYGPWGVQIREVRGGEQYGVSNSHQLIFGLGEETTYDSLIIRWPDGVKETYNQLESDQAWNIHRGGCYSKPEILLPLLDVICAEDSIWISLEGGHEEIKWSNGQVSDSILIKEEGIYYATYKNSGNCEIHIQPVEIIVDPDTTRPVIIFDGIAEKCHGESISLTVSEGQGFLWNNGDTTQLVEITGSGSYYVIAQGHCVELLSDTVSLHFLYPDQPITQSDTFQLGGSAILTAEGDSIVWASDSAATEVLGTGGILQLDDLTETTNVYAFNLNVIEGDTFPAGIPQHEGTKYNAVFINGGLLFDVLTPIVLEEVTVYTDSAGVRVIEIFDDQAFLFQKEVDLEPGTTVVPLKVELSGGSYTISTNTSKNMETFGQSSPYLWRTASNVLYPYSVDNVLTITNSTFGEDFYYYFYNWKISTPDKYCFSDPVEVTAFLDTDVATDFPDHDQLIVYPNPSGGSIEIYSPFTTPARFEVWSVEGVVSYSQLVSNEISRIDLSSVPVGIYILRLQSLDRIYTSKFIKL